MQSVFVCECGHDGVNLKVNDVVSFSLHTSNQEINFADNYESKCKIVAPLHDKEEDFILLQYVSIVYGKDNNEIIIQSVRDLEPNIKKNIDSMHVGYQFSLDDNDDQTKKEFECTYICRWRSTYLETIVLQVVEQENQDSKLDNVSIFNSHGILGQISFSETSFSMNETKTWLMPIYIPSNPFVNYKMSCDNCFLISYSSSINNTNHQISQSVSQ